MPYIITTRHQRDIGHKAGIPWPLDRRAVATLDEAREAAYAVLGANDIDPAPHFDAHFAVDGMTEAGGTVGPLPDGTVIEVRRVDIGELADMADAFPDGVIPDDPRERDEAILAAFNAASVR